MVEQGDDRRRLFGICCADDGFDGSPARDLIVEAPCGQQRLVGSEDLRGSAVEETQFPSADVNGGAPQSTRQPFGELASARRTGAPHRREVLLLVEDEASLVDVAIEMDRQLRNSAHRFVDADVDRRPVGQLDPTGDAEVAIEPRVDQRPAVDLHAQLLPTDATGVGAWLDSQTGGIGVSSDES